MKKFASTLLIVILLLGTLSGCRTQSDIDASTGERKDFVFGVYNFSKVDPADSYNGWGTIRYGVGETLFKLNDNLEVIPFLAESYTLSEDRLTWTLKLREDVKFHNGKIMDGAAVKDSLERLIARNERAKAELMIDSITADGFQVAITTTTPNPALLNSLCDPYACIVDAAADDGSVDFNMYPVGTGPYVMKEYVEDAYAYLEPFADYWGGTPASKSVTIKAIPDVDTLAFALQKGEIDAAYGLSYDTLDQFSNSSDFKVTQAATTRVYMLYFNLEREFMQDPNFRRAIAMAVDKESYARILLNGAGTPTKAAFPSSLSYGDDSQMTGVPDFDRAGARSLLQENGYQDIDGDGMLDKDGKKVSLRLVTYGRTGLPQCAQALQSALQELGIEVSYELFDTVENVLTAGDYDICVYAVVTTPTGDSYAFLHNIAGTGKGGNYGRYSNPEVDALLAQLAVEFDTQKRSELATRIQQIITQDSSYCFMFHLNMFMATKAGVKGMHQSPVDYYQITVETAVE